MRDGHNKVRVSVRQPSGIFKNLHLVFDGTPSFTFSVFSVFRDLPVFLLSSKNVSIQKDALTILISYCTLGDDYHQHNQYHSSNSLSRPKQRKERTKEVN